MYNWNEEKCRQLTNGDIACKYDNVNLEMLRALLNKCAPKDDGFPEGIAKFYLCENNFWQGCDATTKQTVPLSDFIKESEKEFEWTDELVISFANEFVGKTEAREALKLFKKHWQRKCLFTTEDGMEIFEGDEYWTVEVEISSFEICKIRASVASIKVEEFKDFSTEAAALEYVRQNKPLYSLNDFIKASGNALITHLQTETIITELEKLKQ